MSLVKTKTVVHQGTANNVPKDRYTLGDSEMYFEIPKYLNSVEDIDATAVKRLFNNEKMTLEETEGKSLKVMFRTGTETKFCGFVTAGDASRELDESDVDNVFDHARKGKIVKAISPSELVAQW